MAIDATVLAIGVEAKGVQAATTDLGKLSDQAKRTEQATAGLADSFKKQQDAAAKTEQENNRLIESWAREVTMLGKTKSEMMALEAQMRGMNSAQMANVKVLQDKVKAYEQAHAASEKYRANQELVASRISAAYTAMKAAVVGALVLLAKESITAATEAEQASLRLSAVLKATGEAAGVSKQQIDDLADTLAKATKFDDEAIRNAAGTLLTFGKVGATSFERTLRAGTDLAAFMNTDLDSAIRMIGKSLEDPEQGMLALRRAGILLTDSQIELAKAAVKAGDELEAQNIILGALESKVGGVAETMNSGLAKATNDVAKAFGELAESIGSTEAVGGTFISFMDAAAAGMMKIKNLIDGGNLFRAAFSDSKTINILAGPDESAAETARLKAASSTKDFALAQEQAANKANMLITAVRAADAALLKNAESTNKATAATKSHTKSFDDYASAMKLLNEQAKEELKVSEERERWNKKVEASLDKLYEADLKNVEAVNKTTDTYRKQLEALTETEESLLAKTAAQLKDNIAQVEAIGGATDLTEAWQEQLNVINDLIDAKQRDDAAKALAQTAKEAKEEWQRTADSIQGSLTDALLRGFEDGKNWAGNFIDTLKNMFKTLVLRPIIQAVVAPIAGGASSLISGAASALGLGGSADGGGGGLAGLFGGGSPGGSATSLLSGGGSFLSGIGDAIFGGGGGAAFGAGFSSPLSTLGTIFSGAGEFASAGMALASGVGAAIPVIGAAVGIGSLLYSLFGKNDPSEVQGRFQVGGSNFEDNASVQSRFGPIGFADEGTKYFSGEAGKSFSVIVAKLLDAAADQMDAGQVERTAEKLTNTIFSGLEGTFTTQDFIGKYGADILKQTMSAAFEEINPQFAKLMQAFQGSAEEMGGFAERLLQITAITRNAKEQFGEGSLQLNYVERFIERISESDITADSVNSLLAYIDGMSQLSAIIGGSVVEEASRRWQESQRSSSSALADMGTRVIELATNLDDSAESMASLTIATGQYREAVVTTLIAIQQIKQQVEEMFASTRESLETFGLSPEALYNRYKADADAAAELLKNETDPAVIAKLAERINNDIQKAFSVLDETGKGLQQNPLIKYLDDINAFVQTRLTELGVDVAEEAEGVFDTVEQALERAANGFETAATTMQTAADAALVAANNSQLAAATSGQAANAMGDAVRFFISALPIPVSVTVNTAEVNA